MRCIDWYVYLLMCVCVCVYVCGSNVVCVFLYDSISCIDLYVYLQVVLRDNVISDVADLAKCANVWNIDVSNNRISNLVGFQKFSSLGVRCVTQIHPHCHTKFEHFTL